MNNKQHNINDNSNGRNKRASAIHMISSGLKKEQDKIKKKAKDINMK